MLHETARGTGFVGPDARGPCRHSTSSKNAQPSARNLVRRRSRLPIASVGAWLGGGVLSLGSLIGFVTVLGIAARNAIVMISHLRHIERDEGEPFGLALVLRGAEERLSPVLMTALSAGLALVPLILTGNRPGQEIEYPLAVVIVGGIFTSTALCLLLLPGLYLRFARPATHTLNE